MSFLSSYRRPFFGFEMSLIRSFFYIVFGTLARAVNGLVVLKILAFYTNPAEFGRLTQIMGIVALSGMLAAGGIGAGLTRQLASNQNPVDQRRWLAVALRIYLVASVVIGIFLVAASSGLARWLLNENGYSFVFVCLALGQAIIGASNLAQSIAAARADYLFILGTTIIGSVAGVLAVGFGIWAGGAVGAAIALVINSSFPGLVAVAIKRRALWHLAFRFRERVQGGDVVLLLKYASVALIGATSLSFAQIAGRNLVGQSLGWDVVGLWQTVVRISDVYMQLISVLLMAYILPRLSRHSNFVNMHPTFLRLCGSICGVFIFGATFIYVFREAIIPFLFSRAFLPASALLLPQMLGDFFRIIAVCLSVALMARGVTKMSMFYEGVQGVLTFILTAALLGHSEIAAPLEAYCITYAVLMLLLAYVYRSHLRISRPS